MENPERTDPVRQVLIDILRDIRTEIYMDLTAVAVEVIAMSVYHLS